MVRVGIAAPLAGAAATLLGIGHAYWAIAAAVLVLHQGADRSRTLRRGAERLVGTWVGLALAGGIMWLHPQGLWLALILAVLQFVIEMLVVTSRFQESTRLVESIADTVDAVAVTSTHLAAPDTATLPARAARRDLQLAAVTMRDAADAAEAGSVQQRATALRLAPVVTATEPLPPSLGNDWLCGAST